MDQIRGYNIGRSHALSIVKLGKCAENKKESRREARVATTAAAAAAPPGLRLIRAMAGDGVTLDPSSEAAQLIAAYLRTGGKPIEAGYIVCAVWVDRPLTAEQRAEWMKDPSKRRWLLDPSTGYTRAYPLTLLHVFEPPIYDEHLPGRRSALVYRYNDDSKGPRVSAITRSYHRSIIDAIGTALDRLKMVGFNLPAPVSLSPLLFSTLPKITPKRLSSSSSSSHSSSSLSSSSPKTSGSPRSSQALGRSPRASPAPVMLEKEVKPDNAPVPRTTTTATTAAVATAVPALPSSSSSSNPRSFSIVAPRSGSTLSPDSLRVRLRREIHAPPAIQTSLSIPIPSTTTSTRSASILTHDYIHRSVARLPRPPTSVNISAFM